MIGTNLERPNCAVHILRNTAYGNIIQATGIRTECWQMQQLKNSDRNPYCSKQHSWILRICRKVGYQPHVLHKPGLNYNTRQRRSMCKYANHLLLIFKQPPPLKFCCIKARQNSQTPKLANLSPTVGCNAFSVIINFKSTDFSHQLLECGPKLTKIWFLPFTKHKKL